MPISPNMNLSIPVVSTTTGPQYAQDVNASLNKIDGHNHTSGQGVQIPSAGLNINANVAMNGFGLTSTSILNLTSQVVVPSSGTIYRNNDDLWYVDGSGANVRITQGGAVAVSGAVGFSGLPFGTAGASYVSGSQKFVFQSATNTAANVDCGSLLIREVAASANAVTLSSPAALAANYTMRLPAALPAATSLVQSDSSGNLSFLSTSFILPAGILMMYGGSAAPTGWLICDGTVVSQTTYSDLFAVIGSSFNTGGEGAGNFRLPDFRRRVPVGAGGTGTATLGSSVGNSGGAESVTLTTAQMPSHNHGGTTGSTAISLSTGTVSPGFGGSSAANPTSSQSHSHTISSEGGGQAHNNIQPSLVVNYIIKY